MTKNPQQQLPFLRVLKNITPAKKFRVSFYRLITVQYTGTHTSVVCHVYSSAVTVRKESHNNKSQNKHTEKQHIVV